MSTPNSPSHSPYCLLRWLVRGAGVAIGLSGLLIVVLVGQLMGQAQAAHPGAMADQDSLAALQRAHLADPLWGGVTSASTAWLVAGLTLACIAAVVWWVDRLLQGQQRRLQESAAMAAVGELAAVVAHNMRQPLGSIRRSAEFALGAPPQKAQAWAIDVLQDADRIAERIHQLMRLSVATPAGNPTIDLVRLLTECAQDQERLFTRRHLLLRTELPDEPVLVRADAQLLRQVLDGLLNNAADSLGQGGRCRLRLKPLRGGWLRIEVQDNGSGLDHDTLRSVFSAPTAPNEQALGLLLTRRATELLGGRFTLKSQLDVGTSVRIELPAA